jgi:3-keto-disaccharide hydrolase
MFRKNDWNELELSAKGGAVSIRINGVQTAAVHEEFVHRRGKIAFQLWGDKATEVRFKEIEIRSEKEPHVDHRTQNARESKPSVKPPRWLGYDMLGAEPVLELNKVARNVNQVASHSNIVAVPFVDHFAESSIQAARTKGLKVLLYVWKRESMTRFKAKGIQLVKDNSDVVVGVLSACPPCFRIEPSEIEKFAENLKRARPEIEYWVSLLGNVPDQLDYHLPDNVDVLMVNILDCSTIGEAKKRKEEVWPKWIAKAGRRPVVLFWDYWQKSGDGLVAECERGTFKAIGQTVTELNLRGLLFATFCDGGYNGNVYTGIGSRPTLVAEVKSIAREWRLP